MKPKLNQYMQWETWALTDGMVCLEIFSQGEALEWLQEYKAAPGTFLVRVAVWAVNDERHAHKKPHTAKRRSAAHSGNTSGRLRSRDARQPRPPR